MSEYQGLVDYSIFDESFGLPISERAILGIVRSLGSCSLTNSQLGEELGLQERQVRRVISELIKLDWLVSTDGGSKNRKLQISPSRSDPVTHDRQTRSLMTGLQNSTRSPMTGLQNSTRSPMTAKPGQTRSAAKRSPNGEALPDWLNGPTPEWIPKGREPKLANLKPGEFEGQNLYRLWQDETVEVMEMYMDGMFSRHTSWLKQQIVMQEVYSDPKVLVRESRLEVVAYGDLGKNYRRWKGIEAEGDPLKFYEVEHLARRLQKLESLHGNYKLSDFWLSLESGAYADECRERFGFTEDQLAEDTQASFKSIEWDVEMELRTGFAKALTASILSPETFEFRNPGRGYIHTAMPWRLFDLFLGTPTKRKDAAKHLGEALTAAVEEAVGVREPLRPARSKFKIQTESGAIQAKIVELVCDWTKQHFALPSLKDILQGYIDAHPGGEATLGGLEKMLRRMKLPLLGSPKGRPKSK